MHRSPGAKARNAPCPHPSSFQIDGFTGPSRCSGFPWFITVAQGAAELYGWSVILASKSCQKSF